MSKKDNKTTEQFDYNGMPRNQRPRKFSFAWVWLILGLFLIGYNFFFYKGESQETDWKAFKEMLADGDVEKMILGRDLHKARQDFKIQTERRTFNHFQKHSDVHLQHRQHRKV